MKLETFKQAIALNERLTRLHKDQALVKDCGNPQFSVHGDYMYGRAAKQGVLNYIEKEIEGVKQELSELGVQME